MRTRWLAGTVTAFDVKRGLGEVEVEDGDGDGDGKRYPFHCTQIADGSRDIPVGAKIEFEVVPGPLGRWEAATIRTR